MAVACADPSRAQNQCQPKELQSFEAVYRLTYQTLIEAEAEGFDNERDLKSKGARVGAQIESLKAQINPKCFEELEDAMLKLPLCTLRVPVPGLAQSPTATGDITSYLDGSAGGGWIGAPNGVFSYSKNGRIKKIDGDETGGVNEIAHNGEWRDYGFVGILIGARNGLFRYDWKKRSITRIAGDATGSVTAISDNYLATSNGFFRFDGQGRTAKISGEETGPVSQIFRDRTVTIIGAGNGLFRYDWTTNTIARSGGDSTGAIDVIVDARITMLVGGPWGLFRYDIGANQALRISGDETGPVTTVFVNQDIKEAALIGAQNGLFKYDQNRTVKVTGDSTGPVTVLRDTAKGLLVGSQKGLFSYDKNRILKITGEDTGPVRKIYSLGEGYSNTPLIVADNGLFLLPGSSTVRLMPKPNSDAFLHLTKNTSPLIGVNGQLFYLNILPKTYVEGTKFQTDGCFTK